MTGLPPVSGAGVSASLSKMFSRKRIQRGFNGRKIAEALGIGVEELYEALEPKKPASPTPDYDLKCFELGIPMTQLRPVPANQVADSQASHRKIW